MSQLHADYTCYCPASGHLAIATGPGSVHVILATSLASTGTYIELHDSVGDDAAKILFQANVSYYAPLVLVFGPNMPLRFVNGLYVHCGANVSFFVIWQQ